MPLRDLFRPPVSKRSSWEGFHGGWPMRIIEELSPRLPDGFVAEPRVHLGSYYEIDVCTFESHALAVGQPLPSLPVWLSETQSVELELEASYEETCRVLRIS